jgi:ADP-heptose:LPS heptosyltransferase
VLKRTLVVNMNYLGDALMTTPTLALLHGSFGTPVDIIAGGATGYAAMEVLRGNPDIGAMIARPDGGAYSRCVQLFQTVLRGSYEIVVILPSIPAYRWAAALAGAKQVVYVPPCPDGAHMADHMLQCVAARIGLEPGPLKLTLPVTPAARENAARLLKDAGARAPLVGLNVGATRPQKRWPTESFQDLLRSLNARGFDIALLGSPSDKAIAGQIMTGIESPSIVDLTGRTSIADLAAVIERCRAIVTADTGAMHIAAALETPVVALFGSTDPAKTGPVGPGRSHVIYKQLSCAPCNSHPTCNGAFTCMSSIVPDEVVVAVEQVVGSVAKQPRLQIISS